MGDVAASPFASAPTAVKNEGEARPEAAILTVGVSLILGVICRQLCKGTPVPYTVALLILGIVLGTIEYGTDFGLGTLGVSIRIWSTINPELILYIFLPALLFESSFAMEIHQIKRCIMQMVLLACPGVVISTGCLALVNHYLFPYGWNWSTSLLLGGLLSATDPVAVVALLKDLGASKKLSTIVEGESLMNDGTAIVVYKLFFQMMLGQHFSAGDIVKFFSQVALGAVALGIGCGLVTVFWIGRVFNDTIIEITLTLTASYMAFFLAEDEAGVSGVLTVMTIGIFFAAFARTAFTGESQQSMHHFWEMVAYIANTLIFILSGTVIGANIIGSRDTIEAHDWGYLLLLYVFLQLSRAVVVIALYPGLRYFGYGLEWKEAAVLIWAGLRGAVALSLSLSVAEVKGAGLHISKQTQARFVFFTGGVVLLTLVVNGSTTQYLLKILRMDHTPETKALILDHVRNEMFGKAMEAFGDLGEDEDLGPANWTTVCKHISCLEQISNQGARTHPHEVASGIDVQPRKLAFQDMRVRFLNGVQAAYWGMLGEGRITRTSAILLLGSVDEALDHVAQDLPIQDWKGLQPHVIFPKYLKWRSSTLLPQRLLTYVIVEQLELACYIAAAFLRGHRQAQHQLRDFIGQSEIADAVIRESQSEGQAARDFLEDVRLSFPQVLRVIKTKQVTFAVLEHLTAYVTGLEQAGLLEAKEITHLHDMVQVDLKKLHTNPPLVEMPSALEVLKNQPFFGALPIHVQNVLSNKAKDLMMFRDSILYEEDARANGVYLIANGNVKWSGKKYENQHVLHPVFSYGSTLGLYEALTGKPRLCSVTADSVVHCFFIENEILMSIYSEPGLEEFFWQESALVVAKLVVPLQFEAVTMQELRALVSEGSHMHTYIRGEDIEVEFSKIGLLLEGFVKQEGKHDVISAPAGLLGPSGERHPARSVSRTSSLLPGHVCYHTEARARVLFLDLQQIAPSLSSMGSLLPSQHSGLMRFPSKYHNSHRRLTDANSSLSLKSCDVSRKLSTSYSAKAMELSHFGSQVNGRNEGSRSGDIQNPSEMYGSQSQSYPTVTKRPAGNNYKSAYTLASSGKAERTGHVQRRVHSLGNLMSETPSPLRVSKQKLQNLSGYSSGDSDTDEDHIVEIASPSSLFHTDHSVW